MCKEMCGSSQGCGEITIVDPDGRNVTVCQNTVRWCDRCDEAKLEDWLTEAVGDYLFCAECLEEYTVRCVECGRYFPKDGEGDDFAYIQGGGCICKACDGDKKSASYWEGVNHRIDQAIERKHGGEI